MKTRQSKLFNNIENTKEAKSKLKKDSSYECVSENLKFDSENIPKLIIRKKKCKINDDHIDETNKEKTKNSLHELIQLPKKKRKINDDHIDETNKEKTKNSLHELIQLPNEIINNHLLKCAKYSKQLDCKSVYDIISKIKLNDNDIWNNLYSPKIAENFVNGNNKSILKFKNWLENWYQSKTLSKKSTYSDDSDFEPYENCKKSTKTHFPPVCIIQGNRGMGKSSLVHAMANQLNYTVFECNSSSRRTGKDVLDQLENAAISQQVTLQAIDKTVETSLKSSSKQTIKKKSITNFFEPAAKKAKVEITMKRQNSSLGIDNRSLFLFDDVDVLMEEDKGFFNAICTLIEKRNRPIIFTAYDSVELKNCINKIGKHAYLKVNLERNPITDVAVYLQLILLSRGFVVQHGDMLQWIFSCNHKIDIRSCLNNLQFHFVNGRLDFKPKLEPFHWDYYKLKVLRNKALLCNEDTENHSDTTVSGNTNLVCKQSLRNLSSYLNILRIMDSQIPQRIRNNCKLKERDSTIDDHCYAEYDHNVVVSCDISETLTLLYNKTLHNSMTKFETDVLLTSSTPEFNKVRKPSSFPNQMIVDIQNRITHSLTARSVVCSSADRIDRLHYLKIIASNEEKRRTNFTQRRFTHYFDRININLQDLDLKYSLSSYTNP